MPTILKDTQQQILSEWHHLAIRSLLEMKPDPGDWTSLGRRLRPTLSETVVGESVRLLHRGGLVELRENGLWSATEKHVATPPESGSPTPRRFHRDCLQLAGVALDEAPPDQRNITGLTLGISRRTYRLVCDRLTELREEIARLADADDQADQVYQLTLAFFPLSTDNSSTDTEDQP